MIGHIACFALGYLAALLVAKAIEFVHGLEQQYAHPTEEDFV